MRLYLVQHGQAVDKERNPDRPLSDTGRSDVDRVARLLSGAGRSVDRVLHSGKTRARQTAEILASALGGTVEETGGLKAKDPVDGLASAAGHWDADTLVAGHQPFMGKAVAKLLAGDETADLVAFQPGSVACLERDADGNWRLTAFVRPDLLAG